MPKTIPTANDSNACELAKRLGLWGLVSRWDEYASHDWVQQLLQLEDSERQRRTLERRIRSAKLGRFKSMADFDWEWPATVDRAHIDDLFTFRFLEDHANVIFVGPNGTGKTMLLLNLVHQAVVQGLTGRVVTASDLLNDLAAQDGARALQRTLRKYTRPALLGIDELGYLSYDNRHADLLFEVITRRYGQKSTIITTNKPFGEWNEVFPNATCVVTLVDRLCHRAEIVSVDGESYRAKEAKERAVQLAQVRSERQGQRRSAQKKAGAK